MIRTLTLCIAILLGSIGLTHAQTKVACVGDSITAGVRIPKKKRATHSYPAVLNQLLGDQYKVMNLGVSGHTLLRDEKLAWAKHKNAQELKTFVPDIIVFKLGTNDSKMAHWVNKGKVEGDLKVFIAEFKAINPKVKIYLCLPAPCFKGPRTKELRDGEKISGVRIKEELIPIIQKVAKEESLPVIDLNTPFVDHPELFADGCHPNEEGASQIAKIVFEKISGNKKDSK